MDPIRAEIDGTEVDCHSIKVEYPPHPDDLSHHRISAVVDTAGIIITITAVIEGTTHTVEHIEVLRRDRLPASFDNVDWDDVLEGVDYDTMGQLQESLYACLEQNINPKSLVRYLTDRASEVAVMAGMGEVEFSDIAQKSHTEAVISSAMKTEPGDA